MKVTTWNKEYYKNVTNAEFHLVIQLLYLPKWYTYFCYGRLRIVLHGCTKMSHLYYDDDNGAVLNKATSWLET